MKNIVFLGMAMLFFTGPILAKNPKKEVFSESIEPVYGFSGWNRKQPITIQSSQVSGTSDLVDFPVLITLDHLNSEIVDGGGHSALNGGGDIRFSSDAAGNNQLPIEVVEFVTSATPSNRKCQIWVKVPNVSASSNTTIYIWYNKAGEVQPAKSSTYGSQAVWSNYRAIWHMEEDPSGTAPQIFDSGVNANHGFTAVPMLSNDSQPGQIGQSVDLNGTDELINAGNDASLNLGSNITLSGWVNPDSYHDFYMMAKRSETVSVGYNVLLWASNELDFYDSGNNPLGLTYVSNQWNYVVMRLDAIGTGAKGFINGNFSQEVQISQLPDGLAQNLYLGARSNGPFALDGSLDELRISNTYHTDGWITTEYHNQSSPASFAIAGVPESVSGGGDTQAPAPPTLSATSHTDTTVDISWNGATDNVGVTGYKIFKDGALEATLGAVSSHQITGLTASTTYDFYVSALDAAGNESSPSNIVTVTTDAVSGAGGNSGSVWTESGSTANYNGEVAIGTSTVPSGYKLAVEGKIRTREVRVDQDTWPDYVFTEDYKLPTLEEIKKHIEEKGHLPNIPSAIEVEVNGVELGEMNKLLLEKIEQLTLYILQLQEENKKLKTETVKQIENLKERINGIQNK